MAGGSDLLVRPLLSPPPHQRARPFVHLTGCRQGTLGAIVRARLTDFWRTLWSACLGRNYPMGVLLLLLLALLLLRAGLRVAPPAATCHWTYWSAETATETFSLPRSPSSQGNSPLLLTKNCEN